MRRGANGYSRAYPPQSITLRRNFDARATKTTILEDSASKHYFKKELRQLHVILRVPFLTSASKHYFKKELRRTSVSCPHRTSSASKHYFKKELRQHFLFPCFLLFFSASKHYFKKELRRHQQDLVCCGIPPPQSITLRRNFDRRQPSVSPPPAPPQSITLRRNFDKVRLRVSVQARTASKHYFKKELRLRYSSLTKTGILRLKALL